MNALWFLKRPAREALPHVQVKYVVASKSDNTKAARKQAETTAALRRYVVERQLLEAVERAVKS